MKPKLFLSQFPHSMRLQKKGQLSLGRPKVSSKLLVDIAKSVLVVEVLPYMHEVMQAFLFVG